VPLHEKRHPGPTARESAAELEDGGELLHAASGGVAADGSSASCQRDPSDLQGVDCGVGSNRVYTLGECLERAPSAVAPMNERVGDPRTASRAHSALVSRGYGPTPSPVAASEKRSQALTGPRLRSLRLDSRILPSGCGVMLEGLADMCRMYPHTRTPEVMLGQPSTR
jgi:hypothetical protein